MLRSGIMDKRLEIPLMFLASLVISVFGQTIRLVSPLDNGVGRLEVYYNGMWGTVCDDGFGVEEAKVACRQLGRSKSGVTPRAIPSFGFGVGRIWLDDVSCSGTESSLASCSHNPWGANGCSHSEDVGIICDPSDITMKLTPSYKRGLLQVFHSGSWGTVCDDGFGPVEAAVVCRALGYGLGNVIDVSSSNKMWLDDVQCTMLDTDLKDCKHRPWGTHNCGASDAVGVECFSFPEAIHLEPPGSVLNVTLGQVISVVCVGDDFNYPATSFRWTHSGRSYSGQTFSERITSKNDSGTLRCQVVNAMACTEIGVWYPPEVHLEPSNDTINVAVGEDLRVQCFVDDANPSVHTFRWSHNGRTSAGSTFLKRNVTKSDQGQLTCSADNGHMMTPGRADTTVNVRYPPKLHLEPNQPVINVKQGGDVTVVCVVDDANPSATSYMWLHNNNISHGQLFTKGDLSTSDAGNLSCSATNGQGTSLVMTKIIVNTSQASFWIGSDDTTSTNTVIAIGTGSAGLVIIVILIIIIIYFRRRVHAAKPENKPEENQERTAQASRTNEVRRQQNYVTMERPSGAENKPEENQERTAQASRTNEARRQQNYVTMDRPSGDAHIYGNLGFEDDEITRQEQGTAYSPYSSNIQFGMNKKVGPKREIKERKVRPPRGQKNEHVYENTIVRN